LIGVFGVLAGVVALNVLPKDDMAMAAPAMAIGTQGGNESYVLPSQTVIMRGGETLTPNPAQLMFPPDETVAFVVTNDTNASLTFTVGESALDVPAGETATLVYRFSDNDVPYSWGGEDTGVFHVSMSEHEER